VRANLQEKPFNALVSKYAPSWATMRLGPVADFSRVLPATVPGGPTGVPVSSKYEFPSSSSIPAVNIMGSESAAGAAPPPSASNTNAPAAAAPAPSAASTAGATACRAPCGGCITAAATNATGPDGAGAAAVIHTRFPLY
jgi:hypothetical protein